MEESAGGPVNLERWYQWSEARKKMKDETDERIRLEAEAADAEKAG